MCLELNCLLLTGNMEEGKILPDEEVDDGKTAVLLFWFDLLWI